MLLQIGAGDMLALVSSWLLQSHATDGSTSTWQMRDNKMYIRLDYIMASVIWGDAGGGLVKILPPFEFRGRLPAKALPHPHISVS